MQAYIGTKVINATPMDRLSYNVFRGWKLPDDENGTDDGYLVEYTDGGEPNTTTYKGYVSWSPKEQFENAYHPTSQLSFGDALIMLKQGKKVTRLGWNGKGMFIVMMPSLYLPPYNTQDTNFKVNDRTAKHIGEDVPLDSQPYIAMFTATKQWQPGWLASQADMLADDWMVVE